MTSPASWITSWVAALATALGGVASVANAQAPVPEPRFRLGVDLVHSGRWDLEVRTGTFVNRRASYRAGLTAGLRLGVDPTRHIGAFGAFQWNGGGLGDSSGWSFWEVGSEVRPLAPSWFRLKGAISVGRAQESGGVHFGFATIGIGADIALGRRFVGSVSGRFLGPFSPGDTRSAGVAQTTSVNANMGQLVAGVAVRL